VAAAHHSHVLHGGARRLHGGRRRGQAAWRSGGVSPCWAQRVPRVPLHGALSGSGCCCRAHRGRLPEPGRLRGRGRGAAVQRAGGRRRRGAPALRSRCPARGGGGCGEAAQGRRACGRDGSGVAMGRAREWARREGAVGERVRHLLGPTPAAARARAAAAAPLAARCATSFPPNVPGSQWRRGATAAARREGRDREAWVLCCVCGGKSQQVCQKPRPLSRWASSCSNQHIARHE
jgi:hypothetical protein